MQNTLLYFSIVVIAIILTFILNITLLKINNKVILVIIAYLIYLLLFVFIGGQIGNYLNLKILPTRFLALITSCLVIFVAIRMALRIL